MPKLKNIAGQKYGRLVVVHRAEDRPVGHTRWLCRCDCGGETIATPRNLRTGNTKSCGCLHKEILTKKGAAFRQVYSSYKYNAKARNIPWLLTEEQVRKITSSPCYYTGREPYRKMVSKSGEIYVYNGIDRIDNEGPYSIENCVPCCSEVNLMKRALTTEELYKFCEEILEHKRIKCSTKTNSNL